MENNVERKRSNFYENKVMLAPMVRVGTLPMRLLCVRYGAPIVYSEEIIDFKMLDSKRVVNESLGTVDFINSSGSVTFRTCAEEKSKLVFQIGTCDPQRALDVLKLVENDVAAFDVNMGCPREFSVKGGMGAALLDKPDLVKNIMSTLVKNSKIPISCKIRIDPDENKTFELLEKIIESGVDAIGIHGRYRSQTSHQPCNVERIKQLSDKFGSSVTLIANGGALDISSLDEAWNFANNCGCSSVMIARSPQWNPSIFRSEGNLSHSQMVKDYLEIAVKFDNVFSNSKYVISKIIQHEPELPSNMIQSTLSAFTYSELCTVFDVPYNGANEKSFFKRRHDVIGDLPVPQKIAKNECSLYMNSIDYFSKAYRDSQTPKAIVSEHCLKIGHKPDYETVTKGVFFKSYLYLNGEAYTSSYLFKNKKSAEQASAKVYCIRKGLLENE